MTDGARAKAVLFARRPSPYETFPSLGMQESTLSMWAKGMGMDLLRSYRCSSDDYLVARDVIDAMVGFSVRSGVGAMVLWTKEILDDDSLQLLAEVSYTYGIDIWFIADSDTPWTEDDDGSDMDVSEAHPQIEVFIIATGKDDAKGVRE